MPPPRFNLAPQAPPGTQLPRNTFPFAVSNAPVRGTPRTDGMLKSNHKNETVHPYVKRDVEAAKQIPFYAWTEGALNLTKADIDTWASAIDELNWFQDPIIEDALTEFAVHSNREVHRYIPFVTIANRILELAKGTLPDVPHSYPIDDIQFVKNDPTFLLRIPEHGELAAFRRPDILVLRGVHAPLVGGARSPGVAWSDVLAFAEFKRCRKNLRDLLAAVRSGSLPPVIESRDATPELDDLEPPPEPTPPPRSLRPRPSYIDPDCEMEEDDSHSSAEGSEDNDSSNQSSYHPGAKPALRNFLQIAATGDSAMDIRREPVIQAGGYALETAACTYGTRLFVHGIVIEDDDFAFWYYDSSGYLRTKHTLSLFTDFSRLAAVLVGFARGDASQWGALPPVISPPSSGAYPDHFPPKSLADHSFDMTRPRRKGVIRVTLKAPIFAQYGLVGRRTFLYKIETNSVIADTPLVVKISYQVVGRKPEHDVLAIANKARVGHLPEVHMWSDLWKLSDGVRQIFYERSKEMSKDETNIATYEDRVLRALVYTEYLPLNTLFSDPDNLKLIPVMATQMLDCLHDLRYKAKILHRDISCNNIMYEMRRGKPYFILIDFDFAAILDAKRKGRSSVGATSKHRTGTLPFMAHELLQDMTRMSMPNYVFRVVHRLRHDYESLFFVTLWCTITMPEITDKKLKKRLVDYVLQWETSTVDSISTFKSNMIRQLSPVCDVPLPPSAEFLRPFFSMWCVQFYKGYRNLDDKTCNSMEEDYLVLDEDESTQASVEEFDIETLGGFISRDAIMAILSRTKGWRAINTEAVKELRTKSPPGFKKARKSPKVATATRSKSDRARKASTTRKVNVAQKSQRTSSPQRLSPPIVIRNSVKAVPVAKNVTTTSTRVTRSMTKKGT
ncbi:hypothetical protein PHLCEN_2v3948 [Hermanssonia centrifuga]|uniref:Protein kinase domain-containing protein n=1 Tax=Hermanssonia centrifuga TaxID=98765 RepID=A0A2R6Q7L9_9APHY|nr:hypothetical protein PHLCEN_2v3948 [Hermanssonia centrifuga]